MDHVLGKCFFIPKKVSYLDCPISCPEKVRKFENKGRMHGYPVVHLLGCWLCWLPSGSSFNYYYFFLRNKKCIDKKKGTA